MRIRKADLDRRVLRLQPLCNAGERAAGADGADEAIDLAVRVAPDLRRRGFHMRVTVGDVVELVGPDGAVRLGLRQLLGEPAGDLHVVVGVLVGNGRHFDELGAKQPQGVLLFLALGFRNDDDGAIAKCLADQRQPDAGVAGRAFDDDPARAQLSAPFRLPDDPECGAVFHRLPRIEELGLAEDVAARGLRHGLQPNQGCVADRFEDGR
ncbi:hypothetical protein D9M72_546980 [compost metagenome]